MNAGKNHRALPNVPFDDCGCSVRKLTDNRTPSGKFGAVLPILIECRPFRHRDPHRCLADTAPSCGVEIESHARAQIKAMIRRRETARQKAARADAKIMQ